MSYLLSGGIVIIFIVSHFSKVHSPYQLRFSSVIIERRDAIIDAYTTLNSSLSEMMRSYTHTHQGR
jgi:hypothetical protein